MGKGKQNVGRRLYKRSFKAVGDGIRKSVPLYNAMLYSFGVFKGIWVKELFYNRLCQIHIPDKKDTIVCFIPGDFCITVKVPR